MPTSLQGLNLVYTQSRSVADSRDILSTPPGFPDLTAQLDLWTHLAFASDEPFIDTHRKASGDFNTLNLEENLSNEEQSEDMVKINNKQSLISSSDKPAQTSADNTTPSIDSSPDHQTPTHLAGTPASFDLGSFLAGFGIDPFLVPPQAPVDLDFSSLSSSSKSSPPSSSNISPSAASQSQPDDEALPQTKRFRTKKPSIVSPAPAIAPSSLQQAIPTAIRAVSEFSEDHDPLTTPLTASEDKRRRNTAASARFRAKKKEREQALERRSKELESRVSELERECEGLRRENGWLKGLVVGVTGSNPSVVNASADNEVAGVDSGKKRKRESDVGPTNS